MLIGIGLFSGIGGMTLGFQTGGICVPVGVEIDTAASKYHQVNFPNWRVIEKDIREVSGKELINKPDIVFGGPPCQGFSIMGKRNSNDERNLLMYEFARLVKELRPKVFVIENVKGLVSKNGREHLERLLKQLDEYEICYPLRVLNAWHYGVPQKRERVFVLGTRKDVADGVGSVLNYPEAGVERLTVRDAIADLPLGYSTSNDVMFPWYGVGSEYGRKLQLRRGSARLTGCRMSKHSQEIIKRFLEAPPGKKESISRFYKLDWNQPANTLLAGTGSDRGGHTAPRPIHPSEGRCITVREAARLHSCPDWFQFHPTVWKGMRQIGNSVPPLLGKAIAEEVTKFLGSA